MAKKAKSQVVSATGVATAAQGQATDLSRRIEAAMSAAIEQAAKDGVTDPKKVRERMMAARGAVLQGE